MVPTRSLFFGDSVLLSVRSTHHQQLKAGISAHFQQGRLDNTTRVGCFPRLMQYYA
jgi:hypothetical protein